MKIAKQSVEYVDHMGSDLSVVNAARVSFAKESEWVLPEEGPSHLSNKDTKLISYLAKHGHWSPFAHTSISLRIKAPIFIARQLVKHQVGLSWNEVSRRYVDDEPEFYFPEVWRGKPENAKQGSSGEVTLDKLRITPGSVVGSCLLMYKSLLAQGVAPEQARMVLPQNTMTEWIWTGSLMAFARVCKQRLDPHAQQEAQEVAKMIQDVVKPLFPVSWEALMER
jgi:thymidylate synthase (FAD)